LTLVLILNALSISVQNFAAIGRRSSEISRPKKGKETPAKYQSAPKAIASGRTKEKNTVAKTLTVRAAAGDKAT